MDAKRQMGDRRYHQQVLHDMNEHEHFGATDEVDISTTKDYMQVNGGGTANSYGLTRACSPGVAKLVQLG